MATTKSNRNENIAPSAADSHEPPSNRTVVVEIATDYVPGDDALQDWPVYDAIVASSCRTIHRVGEHDA